MVEKDREPTSCAPSRARLRPAPWPGSSDGQNRPRSWTRCPSPAPTMPATHGWHGPSCAALGAPGADGTTSDWPPPRGTSPACRAVVARSTGAYRGRRVRRRQPVHQRAPTAQAALAAFSDRPVALLVGGKDRGLDYAPLGRTVAQRTAPTLILTLPDNGPRIGVPPSPPRPRPRPRPAPTSRSATPTTSTTQSPPPTNGPRPAGSSCCPRPRRVSDASPIMRTRPRPSPPPQPSLRHPQLTLLNASRASRAPATASSSRSLRKSRTIPVGRHLGRHPHRPRDRHPWPPAPRSTIRSAPSPASHAHPRSGSRHHRSRSDGAAPRTWKPRCPPPAAPSDAATMASAATGSVATAARTAASSAAVAGVASTSAQRRPRPPPPQTTSKKSAVCASGLTGGSSARLACTNWRAVPSGSCPKIPTSVTGSSASSSRYCSA